MLRFSKLKTSNIFHLYIISNFSFFFIIEWSTLSVKLNFTTIAVFLSKLADFPCSINAYVVMASYFWKKFKKRLRNGQCLTLKNQETVSVWKLEIFKKLQHSPLITVSCNRILRVPAAILIPRIQIYLTVLIVLKSLC